MRDLVIPRLYDDKEAEILIVGCGNSGESMLKTDVMFLEISQRLYEEGYHYITNADFSTVCIEEMRERNAHLDEMDCKPLLFLVILSVDVEMDLTEPLDILDSDSFTIVIDKGTLDCVACSAP